MFRIKRRIFGNTMTLWMKKYTKHIQLQQGEQWREEWSPWQVPSDPFKREQRYRKRHVGRLILYMVSLIIRMLNAVHINRRTKDLMLTTITDLLLPSRCYVTYLHHKVPFIVDFTKNGVITEQNGSCTSLICWWS